MTGGVRIRRAGDRASLLVPEDPADLPSLVDAVRRIDFAVVGIEDLLPAAETVLVTFTEHARRDIVDNALRTAYAERSAAASAVTDHAVVEIPVRYDGSDLADVAEVLGMSVEEVVAAHGAAQWRCAFIGFAPGFGYLTAPDSGLTVPRRAQSRTSVPAGAVALAGGYSAVYPRTSPGGWQIIGTTDARMWDLDRPTPNLIGPGSRVRFVEAQR